jgi:YfiH family protein
MAFADSLLRPRWPAPSRVQAVSTTRLGGASDGAYASLNLATHVGDDAARVQANRALLKEALGLPAQPQWLDQVHGTRVLALPAPGAREADAAWTAQPGLVCAVQTADCLPVLFCDTDARCVAVAHAGWRGLADGVLEATVAALPVPPAHLLAWFGPAIGASAFEVGGEVRERFVAQAPEADEAFVAGPAPGKFFCDLAKLARQRLRAAGVHRLYGGGLCTYSEPARFYSFRRDGRCGRMASLIWLAS